MQKPLLPLLEMGGGIFTSKPIVDNPAAINGKFGRQNVDMHDRETAPADVDYLLSDMLNFFCCHFVQILLHSPKPRFTMGAVSLACPERYVWER